MIKLFIGRGRLWPLVALFAVVAPLDAPTAQAQGSIVIGPDGSVVIDGEGGNVTVEPGGVTVEGGAAPGGTGQVYNQVEWQGRDLRDTDLRGVTISYGDLQGANLSGMDLTGTIFSYADLQAADFTGANLTDAVFSYSDLHDADLSGACAVRTVFSYVDAPAMRVERTIMIDTVWSYSDAPGVDFSRSITSGPTDCSGQGRAEVTPAAAIAEALIVPGGRVDLTVNFATDSDRIEGQAASQLAEIAAAIGDPALTQTRIMIEGHTDAEGSDEYNLDLSYRRALAVMRGLTETYGVDAIRLQIQGFGEGQPIAGNDTESGRALNRRVTLVNAGPL